MPTATNNKPEWLEQKFGRLTVVGFENRKGVWYWKCTCECGKQTTVNPKLIKRGSTLSCGCLGKEKRLAALTKGRHEHWNLYGRWAGMKNRCQNPNEPGYKNYGARGITVCSEWQEYEPFERWALENGYREDLTLDRIDNNGAYSPDNCRWVSQREQCRNRRSNINVEVCGAQMTLTEACETLGMDYKFVHQRLKNGMTFSQAISVPKMKNQYI